MLSNDATRYVTSADGTRIAYDIQGEGPAILLLHSLEADRQVWHRYGYVEQLARLYTVITIDLRGCGKSELPPYASVYTREHFLTDLLAVVDACRVHSFFVWGHAFGAAIALQLASSSTRVRAAISMGSAFGDSFLHVAQRHVEELDTQRTACAADPDSDTSELDRRLVFWRVLESWPVLEPQDVACPVLFLAGATAREELLQSIRDTLTLSDGIERQHYIFDDVHHEQILAASETVLPVAQGFLQRHTT